MSVIEERQQYFGSIADAALREQANGPDTATTKQSNPKDIIGSRKLDLGCVPYTLLVCAARALWEGVVKYGRFNWRICGIRASIYHAALLRHVAKWWNGQNCDKLTRVHHLDNAIACLAILRDAELYGCMTDDRPPCPDPDAMAMLIDEGEETVAHLGELFADKNPRQYTIADTPRRAPRTIDRLEVRCDAPQVLSGCAVRAAIQAEAPDLSGEPWHRGEVGIEPPFP